MPALSPSLASLVLLAAGPAVAGDPTPPGLEKGCAEIEPTATSSEVMSSALSAGFGNHCDHAAYSDGVCVPISRSLAVTGDGALAVEVLEITELESGDDGPLYVASGFNLDPDADPATQAVTVLVDGKPLLEDVVLGEELQLLGYLAESPDLKGVRTHVIEAHGARLELPVSVDDTVKEDALALSAVVGGSLSDGTSSTYYDLVVERAARGDDPQPLVVKADIQIVFTDAR